ncbi:MAG: hypothetical protein OXM01_09310, partial [Gemmatimonadota bacterium]|nr:hypothetical protein [Gemmatimonadota bacterium]
MGRVSGLDGHACQGRGLSGTCGRFERPGPFSRRPGGSSAISVAAQSDRGQVRARDGGGVLTPPPPP